MARDAIISIEVKGIKEINAMFMQVPKQVKQYKIWTKFWRKVTKPLAKAAKDNAPIAEKDIKYPSDTSKTITKGTLKKSIGFFQTKASKEHLGGYIGPKVKGKFAKNKGGYYGAWIEYGSEVKHFGKHFAKDQPFMEDAWKSKNHVVLENGFKDAEKIFKSVMKSHEKRLQKYGKLGY
jgi:hypothetical protein